MIDVWAESQGVLHGDRLCAVPRVVVAFDENIVQSLSIFTHASCMEGFTYHRPAAHGCSWVVCPLFQLRFANLIHTVDLTLTVVAQASCDVLFTRDWTTQQVYAAFL